jgi:hypothetical protein
MRLRRRKLGFGAGWDWEERAVRGAISHCVPSHNRCHPRASEAHPGNLCCCGQGIAACRAGPLPLEPGFSAHGRQCWAGCVLQPLFLPSCDGRCPLRAAGRGSHPCGIHGEDGGQAPHRTNGALNDHRSQAQQRGHPKLAESEGTPRQFAPECVRVMGGSMWPPGGGGEKPSVIPHLFSAKALKSRGMFFQKPEFPGGIRSGFWIGRKYSGQRRPSRPLIIHVGVLAALCK